MNEDKYNKKLNNTDKKLHISDVSCRSLLDELLNYCDILIKGNDNNEEWSKSFIVGIYAVRGKISHLKTKLNDN